MRALLALLAGCATASSQPRTDDVPVVIELFTSQGCSSCPPAEQLLGKLAHAGTVGNRTVAPLAFHVDYWDDLGWKDPFSLPAWTARQQNYARALGDDRVYTPELVVAGGAGMVGSQWARVEASIMAAPRQHDRLHVAIETEECRREIAAVVSSRGGKKGGLRRGAELGRKRQYCG